MTMILDGTNGETFPTWTTSTRPASPSVAQVGWNTTIGSLENYNGSAWTAVGGGGAGSWQSVQASNFAAVSGNAYAINTTSSAITVTLPASPSAGNYIQLVDYAGTWGTNAVTVNPNGLKLQGSTSSITLSTNRQAVAIVYIDSTQGWICYSQGASVGPYSVTYLAVAGGGGGAGANFSNITAGGGGAGGLLTGTATLNPGTGYTVTIGAGGAGGPLSGSNSQGINGSNSSLGAIATAIGGGGGGGNPSPYAGNSGGSGGGGAGWAGSGSVGGSGTSGQGFAGGNGGTGTNGAAGGGGAGGAGTSMSAVTQGQPGGVGLAYSITGTSVYYAGGGGGGSYSPSAGGAGGNGGGGAGGNGGNGIAGTSNTGGGGGGSGGGSGVGGSGGTGGSGIVIISYSGAQRGTGGTVTSSGGNTIHTFTSSGTYTA